MFSEIQITWKSDVFPHFHVCWLLGKSSVILWTLTSLYKITLSNISHIPNVSALLHFSLFATCRGKVCFMDFHWKYFQKFWKCFSPSSLYVHWRLKENILLALHTWPLEKKIFFLASILSCKLMVQLFFCLPYCSFTFNVPNFVILYNLLTSTQPFPILIGYRNIGVFLLVCSNCPFHSV